LTIHAAKGLEWRCVLVVGLEEGLLPHGRCVDPSEIEEGAPARLRRDDAGA